MNASHVLYWIWLSLCLSPGSKSSDILLERFGGAKEIFEAPDGAYDALDLTEETKARLKNKDSAEAKKIYYYCKDRGVTLLAFDDDRFPARLRTIDRKPVLLYCKGTLPDFNRDLFIAAVGTRRMTSYGKRSAYEIAFDLACAGAVVVSGLARGVDAVCHRASLDAHGKTVAVLGCGVDVTYPKENFELQNEIERKGVVISEFRPGTRPGKTTFPIRNRIISGLSQGTFVVEGDKHSGAMITARLARQQGRTLFSLPGMVGELNSEGTNDLLREGAIPVTCAFDLLEEFTPLYPDRVFPERIPVFRPKVILTDPPRPGRRSGPSARVPDKDAPAAQAPSGGETPADQTREEPLPRLKRTPPPTLNARERTLFETLDGADRPLSSDELCDLTGMNAGEVMTAMTMMEIAGVVLSLPGGRFLLN